MPKLAERVELVENSVAEYEDRLTGIVARLEWMQVKAAEAAGVAAQQQQPRIRYLNGSWPLRDGDNYPQDHRESASPYESWWRRSPPATE